MAQEQELRSAVRFPIHIPLSVHGPNSEVVAETQDISAGGVLFQVDVDMPAGSRIEFTLNMPGQFLGTPTDVTVQCVGRVVRSTLQDGRRTVAAVIDEYSFDRA